MNKTLSSRTSWRYVAAGILLIAATMAGGSAVAHDAGRSSPSAKASGSKSHPGDGSSNKRKKHHWKKSHRPAPTLTPTTDPATLTPTPPVDEEPTNTTPQTGFPNASNTGVPSGTTLTAYTGPKRITQAGTVIDSKTVQGSIVIAASNVTIKNSKLIGTLEADTSGAKVTVTDSEIDGGQAEAPAVGYRNVSLNRVNVHGSRVSVLCGSNCEISNSWLHGQYLKPGSNWHVNGYLSNGGSNVVLRHNTLACEQKDNGQGGGCTGPAASFGDFDPLSNITYDSNLFVAGPGSYCLYAGYNPDKPYGSNPTGVVVNNNVFERGSNKKCASYGPVTSFKSGGGNSWSNNKWSDGATLNP